MTAAGVRGRARARRPRSSSPPAMSYRTSSTSFRRTNASAWSRRKARPQPSPAPNLDSRRPRWPAAAQPNSITLRFPSWASISSKPASTSSSVRRCDSRPRRRSRPRASGRRERHLASALDAAERRAGHTAAGDQEARHDLEHLPLARDAAHRREPPGLAGGLDGLPHHGDVPRRLERVVGAEPARLGADPVDRVGAGEPCVGCA